jgi:hypothetical protein
VDSSINDDALKEEVYGKFMEHQPNSKLKPIKMMDEGFGVNLCYGSEDENPDGCGIDYSVMPNK